MTRYRSSSFQLRKLGRNLLLGILSVFATPGYVTETSQFSAVLKVAREGGSEVEQISTACTPHPKNLLGYLDGTILCLRKDVLPQTAIAGDSSTILALALSHAVAEADNRRKAKLTLGSLIEGMAAAAVESDIQGRESARPERQARHDRPYALDRDRPYSTDRASDRVKMDFWVKRGLSWAKQVGACEGSAVQLLERIRRSELANPQDRADAKALLDTVGFLRYHPEPCT